MRPGDSCCTAKETKKATESAYLDQRMDSQPRSARSFSPAYARDTHLCADLKLYLRSTMTAQRLNSMLLLHVHKDLTDKIDIREIAAEFAS